MHACVYTGGKSVKKIYDRFYQKLVQKLPIKDATFIATLHSAGLFGNGNLKKEVATKDTEQQAAIHFLDKAISTCLPDDDDDDDDDDDVDLKSLYDLLKAMERHGGAAKTLAKKMKKAIATEGIYLFCIELMMSV